MFDYAMIQSQQGTAKGNFLKQITSNIILRRNSQNTALFYNSVILLFCYSVLEEKLSA